MCIDDYQFRHYSAKREKECRRFVFQTEQGNQRAFLVNISQFEKFGQLYLCEILMHLSKKGLKVNNFSFFVPHLNIIIEAGDNCRVPFESLMLKEVHFIMKQIDKEKEFENFNHIYLESDNLQFDETEKNSTVEKNVGSFCCFSCFQWSKQNEQKMSEEEQSNFKNSTDGASMEQEKPCQSPVCQQKNSTQKEEPICNIEKKHKQQEKTIQQALLKTKTWRKLHEVCNFSLKNAARLVELSKKTLDDYFLVLRVGEAHQYDFASNLTKKIGHLRAFIRNQSFKITGRLPKQVKSFNLVEEPNLSIYSDIVSQQKAQQNIIQIHSNNSPQ